MVAKQFRIVWTKRAEQHLREIYEHISLDSPQNALKVVGDITKSMEKTIANPDVYPADNI